MDHRAKIRRLGTTTGTEIFLDHLNDAKALLEAGSVSFVPKGITERSEEILSAIWVYVAAALEDRRGAMAARRRVAKIKTS